MKQESQILPSWVNALRAKVVSLVSLLGVFSPLDFGLINPIVFVFDALAYFYILKAFLGFFFKQSYQSGYLIIHILEYFLFFYAIIL